ncbi:MAG: hypothetical protein WAM14_00135 [Candidatus Nitrosopolaris sp.]
MFAKYRIDTNKNILCLWKQKNEELDVAMRSSARKHECRQIDRMVGIKLTNNKLPVNQKDF